ncbi:MAG: NrdH-redoxin [Candidatus Wildermuthbacteria bacterium RIFCSPHIGHO2_01_FULL_47_27]|nr:MAG: NrdH-redoxin [Candidatus Wildermuthbacteria bacterium RIFCSPHIGHO2_01_FULL_47_27]OHA75468.1 MAG: NrdH-redoxin [Candidatus Wildermuthbacteria bacterium RIFCSPLOWO2_02_FULL_47_10]
MIKIYSSPTCVYCNTLKAYLKEHAIEFEEINVAGNQKALKEMIEKSGQMGVPVVDIDGQIVVGFNKEEIKKLLKIQ